MRTLVIDVGTSGLRAAIVHDDASVSDLHHEEFAPSTPAPGLVEFDAEAMWQAVRRVALKAMDGRTVDAVGITNQRASTVGWRRSTGMPTGPAIGWQDLRTVGDCIMARTTHGFALAPNQSATKITWMLADLAANGTGADDDVIFGTVDSWIAWKLTGGAAHVTDHTNAAVTGLTVADGSSWNATVLHALGIDAARLPTIVHTFGHVAPASELPGSPPITALIGDQQASLVGQGCITRGSAKITFGTGGMLDMFVGPAAPSHARRSDNGTFPIVAHSSTHGSFYGVESIMLSAGTNVEWLRDDMGLISSPAESDTVASGVTTTDGVVYVPALLGLGTPHWDYGARGAIFGITRGTTRAHIVRAVLEGIAHRGADLLDAAEADTGISVPAVNVDGGMSRNRTFVQALADACGRPVTVSPVTEATTLGAGIVAGTAVGQWADLGEACSRIGGFRSVAPLGAPGVSRQQWGEAVSRARAWIPDLSTLDF